MNENDDPGKMIRKRDQDTKRRFAHKANKRREDEQAIKSEEHNPSSDTAIKKKKLATHPFPSCFGRGIVGVVSNRHWLR